MKCKKFISSQWFASMPANKCMSRQMIELEFAAANLITDSG